MTDHFTHAVDDIINFAIQRRKAWPRVRRAGSAIKSRSDQRLIAVKRRNLAPADLFYRPRRLQGHAFAVWGPLSVHADRLGAVAFDTNNKNAARNRDPRGRNTAIFGAGRVASCHYDKGQNGKGDVSHARKGGGKLVNKAFKAFRDKQSYAALYFGFPSLRLKPNRFGAAENACAAGKPQTL